MVMAGSDVEQRIAAAHQRSRDGGRVASVEPLLLSRLRLAHDVRGLSVAGLGGEHGLSLARGALEVPLDETGPGAGERLSTCCVGRRLARALRAPKLLDAFGLERARCGRLRCDGIETTTRGLAVLVQVLAEPHVDSSARRTAIAARHVVSSARAELSRMTSGLAIFCASPSGQRILAFARAELSAVAKTSTAVTAIIAIPQRLERNSGRGAYGGRLRLRQIHAPLKPAITASTNTAYVYWLCWPGPIA